MARYSMQDGSVVSTEDAPARWQERTGWSFSGDISKATGSEWEHETLYRSQEGQYFIEHTSQRQGAAPYVLCVDPEQAYQWLLANDYDENAEDLPEELGEYVGRVMA